MFRMALKSTLGSVLLVACVSLESARAGFIINAGHHTLFENTPGQIIQLEILGDGLGAGIHGTTLRIALGDGLGPALEPRFAGVTWTDGPGGVNYFWDASNSFVILGGKGAPTPEGDQLADVSASNFLSGGTPINFTGTRVLATFGIDTTGIFFDSANAANNLFAVVIDGSLGANGPGNSFVTFGPGDGSAVFNNGSISITAVPEPTSFAFVGLAGAGAYVWRRRRRKLVPVEGCLAE
jgi:hypothetical protein